MGWLEGLRHDFRYALRSLSRSRAYTIGVIATLGVAIGANTAIFSIVSGVLLRPLPFPEPARLVQISQVQPNGLPGPVPYPMLTEYRRQNTSFESIGSYGMTSKSLAGVDTPEQVPGVAAERAFFQTLGVSAQAGRTFRDDDPLNVAVINAGFANRHFGGASSAIGRTISLDSEAFTILGVMPEGFQFPYRTTTTELWIPWEAPAQYRNARNYRVESVLARLKPGVTVETATSELNAIASRFAAQFSAPELARGAKITPLSEEVAFQARPYLLLLMAAAGVVLLVACLNVANLSLARAILRGREAAIRVALGARRWRLVRQVLAESLVLALAGGLGGLAIGSWGASLLVKLASAQIPRAQEIGLDWRVFLFLMSVCLLTAILFGLIPASVMRRADARGLLIRLPGTGGGIAARFRDALVVAEVAMAFVLLIGAGLLVRTFVRLQHTNAGVAPENVLTAHLTVAPAQRQSPEAAALYCRTMDERIRRIPGVRAAGFISLLPLQNSNWTAHFSIRGRAAPRPQDEPVAELRYVTPGYFEAMGVPILRGRGFTEQDTGSSQRVILVNESLAKQHFANQDPVGRVLDRGLIIGVTGDVHQAGLRIPPTPEIYYALAQNFAQIPALGMTVVVRAQANHEILAAALRAAVREVNPDQPVFNLRAMRDVITDSFSDVSLSLWLLVLFAGLALLLAVMGIYSVISYAVASRTQEFGIRMALGADTRMLLAMVLRRGQWLTGLGLALGLGGALAATRLLASLLFGVTPTDPLTFALVALLVAAAALLACIAPARRAARVDPSAALRAE